MAKASNGTTPKGSTSVDDKATANGNPFTNVKSTMNGENQPNGKTTNDGLPKAETSGIMVGPNIRARPTTVTKRYQKDLGAICGNALCDTSSLEAFLDFIARDRLRHMPHKGSKKDKILRWAEYFGTRISELHESVEEFVPHSLETAQLIWECCRVLIQMGEQHLNGLDKIVGVFYKIGLQISSILRNRHLFNSNAAIEDQLSVTYAELLEIVVEMTMTYYRRSKTTSSLRIDDIDKIYGKRIDQFFFHRDQISNNIWRWQLEQNTDSRNITIDIGTIRTWLCPQDRILRLLASDTMNSRGARDEFTCEWFQSHLLDFSRGQDQLLAITGGSGSGKSILSGWIAERLERALGGKSYLVNSIIIDSTLRSEATSLGVLKRLLLHSLEQNVGNVKFYQHLLAAFEMSASSEIEEALWLALETALDIDQDIMIIIDGLDQLTDFKTIGHQFLDRLSVCCSKHKNHVKYIILSNESSHKAFKIPHRKFSLEPDDDLRKVIYNSLASYHHFHDRKEQDKNSIIQRILEASKGNYVLADLIIQLLRREKTHDNFTHALGHIPKSISNAMEKLIAHLDISKPETQLVLSWLIVAERNLSLLELQALLEVNVSTKKRSRNFDVEDLIRHACGPLLEVRDGIVHFRHITIRQHLVELSTGKTLIKLQDAHSDLTTRCLAYTNTHVTTSGECAIDALESSKVDVLFQKHHLLEYTVRYWTQHFRSSSMYRKNGKHEISESLRHSFSGSVLLAQIERSCWETQSSIIEALEMHKLALSMRKIVLTETHEAVLQCIITIASTYEKISSTVEASTYYYQATKLSRKIFGIQHTITVGCAETYLTCTQSIVSSKKTEITTRREEMLHIVITVHEQQHSIESLIRYKKLLAQLYVEIQEITMATKVYREVYQACIEHYGEFHSETMTVSKGLTVVLQRGSRHEDVLIFVKSLYEEAERTMEIYDIRRIHIMMRLVEIYESQGGNSLIEAEELLVQFWRKISICHSRQKSVELHERKIEIALSYVRFLRRLSRYEEASGLLRGLWIEYENEDIQSESLIIWIKTIGEELNELRILDVAIQVFTAVWSFYKRIHKQFCVEAISTAIMLTKISIEIRTDESFTDETICTEEEILREIYESTIKTITTTTITTTTVTTCETLSSFYFRSGRWSEATTVCREVLKGLWSGVILHHGKPSLPSHFTSEAVNMAIRMAHCQIREHQTEKAEKLLVYIFNSTRSHLRIQDELVTISVRELVQFYEERNRPERVIEIYCELLEGYSRGLGKSHPLTLELLYRLAGLCLKQGRKGAEHYYLEIYTNLNRGSSFCHRGAIEAALALTRIYETEKRWESSEKIYKLLWQTVTTCTKEYDITAERVDEIYRRYFYILEEQRKVDYTVLRQITIEFREVCIHVYGNEAEITLKATLRLAEICERSDQHVHEAIQIYEEVCKRTKTTTTTTTVTTITTEAKSRLTKLYVTHSSTSTEFATKAIHLQMELFESTKTHYGCSHELTIKHLGELAVFYKSRNDQKLTITVLETLKSTIIDVVRTEKDSKRLFDCSIKIAKIYIAQGHTHEGYELLAELRRQIISRDTRNSEKCGFKIDQNTDRRSFVFLATFEESLKNTKIIKFSEIMADFLTENIMYEVYTRSLTQKARFEIIMAHGARLRYFRKGKYDIRDSRIDDELFEAFKSKIGSGIKTSTTTTRYFFNIILEEVGNSQQDVHLVKTGFVSGAAAVRVLLEQSKYQEAYDLSLCIFQFTNSQDGYHDQEVINSGFKLALYLAGRGVQPCPEKDPRRKQMMELSTAFVQDILKASRHIHVDFTKTELSELNELVTLLGAQQNYTDLEWLLTQLWDSRHETPWSAQSIIYIGRRLVEVRFSHGDRDSAIHLWEDICYNVRRVWGALDSSSLLCFTLLSELYTATGQHEKAMSVHYEILRQEVSDDNDTSPEEASEHARHHLELLKRAYQRHGRLDKDEETTYADLFKELKTSFKGDRYFDELQPITKWPTKGADDKGTYKPPSSWQIMAGEDERKHQNWLRRRVSGIQRYDPSIAKGKRITSGLHTYIEHVN